MINSGAANSLPNFVSSTKDELTYFTNSIFDATIPSSNSSEKKNKFVVPLAASLGAALFIVTAMVLVLWSVKRRRQRNTVDSRGSISVSRFFDSLLVSTKVKISKISHHVLKDETTYASFSFPLQVELSFTNIYRYSSFLQYYVFDFN